MSVAAVQELLKEPCFNKLFIGGDFVDPVGGGSYETLCPATKEVLHKVPEGTAEDIDKAVAAASAAWSEGAWAGMTATERAKIVTKISESIEAKLLDLAKIEAADVGKPVRQSKMTLSGAAGEGKYFSQLAKTLDKEQGKPVPAYGGPPNTMSVGYRRDPFGVVGLIGAWNYPLNVAFRKVAPALVAGNCAVLKPSEIAGLSCMFLGQACADAGLPNGVFNVVTGGPAAGAALTQHKDVMMVSFTGSSATGSKVMSACAEKLAPVMLELGGKSGLVIFDDVDMDAAVETTMKGFLTNGGQICTAHSRLIVHDTIKDTLIERLKGELESLPFCTDPVAETDRGDHAWESGKTDVVQSIVSEKQHASVMGYIDGAKKAGLEPVTGGSCGPSSGFFVQPTVFVDVPQDAEIWQKEVFGPVLSVRSFSTEDEAVAEANSTRYGLASTVMTKDSARGERVANRIRAGTVFATATGEGILAEFPGVQRGGYGCSGVGRELGLSGLHEYTELKSVGLAGYGGKPGKGRGKGKSKDKGVDADAPLKKPRFMKVKAVSPEKTGMNLLVKCVKCTEVEGASALWEVVCGDETGVVTLSVRSKEQAALCTEGASLRIQNAKVTMVKGYIRVAIDRWAKVVAADEPLSAEVNDTIDVSALEYELA